MTMHSFLSLVLVIAGCPLNLFAQTPSGNPLDRQITLQVKRESLGAFLDEVSKQSGMDFAVDPQLNSCRVSAVIRDVSARDVLKATLGVPGVVFLRNGRSNHYEVNLRKGDVPCPVRQIPADASGFCEKMKGPPISIKCQGGTLFDFAKLLSEQSQLSFFFPEGWEGNSVTVSLSAAKIGPALVSGLGPRFDLRCVKSSSICSIRRIEF